MKSEISYRAAFIIAAISIGALSPGWAHENASWLRTSTPSNVLNPNLSVIADFVGLAGPREDGETNRFSLRETEIGLQAAVDPYARADFFLGVHEGGSPEIEEGYVTLLSLPLGLQARGGKFLANFGRMNMIHTHERPQVDSPKVLDGFLGEEGLNDTGVEVSRIFSPLGLFTEVSYGMLNGLGGHEHEHGGNGETVFIQALDDAGAPLLDVDGNPIYKEVSLREEEEETPRTIRNFAHVARARIYRDITDAANVELGVSGALHQPEGREQRKMGGIDLTFRWKPLREGLYRSFLWRTEAMYSSRVLHEEMDITGAVTSPERRLHRRGGYSYVEYQPARRWRFGVRGDYAEDPEAKDEIFTLEDGSTRQVARSITRGVSPYVTFTISEFNRLRAQYSHTHMANGRNERRGMLQWTVILGPHGAHPF